MKFILVMLFLFCGALAQAQQSKKVLFIGNSYTAVNDLPGMLQQIALSLGDTLYKDSNTPGGYTFQLHSVNTTTLAKINAQDWDHVVLQAQSQEPAFDPAQVAIDTYPYADSLAKFVYQNDSCSRVLFYMTWGRKNGDAANCPFYPVICTYEGMQYRLRQSYIEMAQNNNAQVSPVGVAWRTIRQTDITIELYQPDESHPSLAGTYVAACTFYCSIFHKSLVGAHIPAGLDTADALFIQQISQATVFDSLDIWNIDTTATPCNYLSVVKQHEEDQLKVFPNPFTSTLYFSEDCSGTANITDLSGRVIYTTMLINQNQLKLDFLNSGIYFISLTKNNVLRTYVVLRD
jgi:Secretion system C-terminal sorting domain